MSNISRCELKHNMSAMTVLQILKTEGHTAEDSLVYTGHTHTLHLITTLQQ